jgi:hypothetical protein
LHKVLQQFRDTRPGYSKNGYEKPVVNEDAAAMIADESGLTEPPILH